MAETSERLSTVNLDVRPVTPNIGAEIHGLDLRRPLTNGQVHAIRQAWLKHLVIFFRDQNLAL